MNKAKAYYKENYLFNKTKSTKNLGKGENLMGFSPFWFDFRIFKANFVTGLML
ncbi:hypothetical protein B879_00907 [Cecembia lonarensis LW9]|uniref:Uncharacterized protein n=1 Tax=Cecembia lonarensis (strain CCUG 58316 / KCTC 22772 / LW9) TaxID=1225176 RepID=K1L279_CECL9|nr:hypothetical protein B879_00907 [Cecembia lonarensis LW9]